MSLGEAGPACAGLSYDLRTVYVRGAPTTTTALSEVIIRMAHCSAGYVEKGMSPVIGLVWTAGHLEEETACCETSAELARTSTDL